jgi:4-amino-4-deoxy-L-arabinose transferase-like glycosyltransferase
VKWLVVGAFAVWVSCGLIRWVSVSPLSHDEAHYALAARDLIAGRPARWTYMSVGTVAIGAPGIAMGGSPRELRLVPALLGLVFLACAWRVAAVLAGEESAAWAIAVLAGTTPVTRFQIDLMSDMPSCACLLAAIAILVGELRRERGPRWRIVAAAPLAAAALYLRYGSVVPLAIVGIATLGFARARGKLVVTGLVFALCVPPLVHTLLVSAGVPPPESGLATYAAHPIAYAGALATPLAVIAVAGAWRDRWWLYAAAIGAADILALGWETHAQGRYILLGVVLLVAVGTAVARDFALQLAGPVRRALATLCAMAVIASWIAALAAAWGARDRRIAGMAATLAAADAIHRDARGRACVVVGRHTTQLEWYSGCRIAYDATGLAYVVRDDTGGPDQPAPVRGTTILHTPHVDVTRAATPASADRAGPSRSRGKSPARR